MDDLAGPVKGPNMPTPYTDERLRRKKAGIEVDFRPVRTAHDLPMSAVLGGSALLVVLMFCVPPVSSGAGRVRGPLGEPRGGAAGGGLRLPVRDGVRADRRDRGQRQSSPVSGMTIATLMATAAIFLGQRLDGARVRCAGHHDRRHRLHCGVERRRYLAGSEDRLPDRRDAVEAAGGRHGRRHHFSVFSIGATLNGMNRGLESFQRHAAADPRHRAAMLRRWRAGQGPLFSRDHFATDGQRRARSRSPGGERPQLTRC